MHHSPDKDGENDGKRQHSHKVWASFYREDDRGGKKSDDDENTQNAQNGFQTTVHGIVPFFFL